MQENKAKTTVSFDTAAAHLREMLVFSRERVGYGYIVDHMRKRVEVDELWHPVDDSHVGFGNVLGYARKFDDCCGPLTEKFLSDLGHDLGLPVVTCAFQGVTHQTPEQAALLVSAIPTSNCREVYNFIALTANDGSTSAAYTDFLNTRPLLIDAFLATNIFDLWIGNPSRTVGNMLTDSETLFAVIPDDNILLSTQKTFTPQNLRPFAAFTNFATPQQAPVIALTLQAIEHFPPARIAAAAERLTPLDPLHWKAAEYSDLLTARRPLLRPMLMEVLSPATQKAVAALA
jgi:hypothetical protein